VRLVGGLRQRHVFESEPPPRRITGSGMLVCRSMQKSDVICPKCHAGYRRIELATRKGTPGEYRCLLCDQVLEIFDGSTEIAIRLTVQPEKIFE
jgi:hypothetical protein